MKKGMVTLLVSGLYATNSGHLQQVTAQDKTPPAESTAAKTPPAKPAKPCLGIGVEPLHAAFRAWVTPERGYSENPINRFREPTEQLAGSVQVRI